MIIRPGTDPALALGIAREVIDQKLYDERFVKGHTDLPLLVRMDTRELLRASDAIPGYELAELERRPVQYSRVVVLERIGAAKRRQSRGRRPRQVRSEGSTR